MTTANCLGTYIVPTAAREVTKPSQPAFLGIAAGVEANETGDGTAFILGDTDVAAALTEIFDQNADFVAGSATGATFTSPVTGRYRLHAGIFTATYDGSQTSVAINIITSNGTYDVNRCNPTNMRDISNYLASQGLVLCDMDAADTATVVVTASGGLKVVSIGVAGRATHFAGGLVC